MKQAVAEIPLEVPQPPAVLEEPRAGGNYVRDPVTGALSLNPDHPVPEILE